MQAEGGGKQATKGKKQILQENESTLNFYASMAALTVAIHVAARFTVLLASSIDWGCLILTVACQLVSLLIMYRMASVLKNADGKVLDVGLDLNLQDGFAEYTKDIVILCSLVQLFSLMSAYIWFALLLAPLYAVYKLWANILAPCFFAAPDSGGGGGEDDTKKRRKGKAKDA